MKNPERTMTGQKKPDSLKKLSSAKHQNAFASYTSYKKIGQPAGCSFLCRIRIAETKKPDCSGFVVV